MAANTYYFDGGSEMDSAARTGKETRKAAKNKECGSILKKILKLIAIMLALAPAFYQALYAINSLDKSENGAKLKPLTSILEFNLYISSSPAKMVSKIIVDEFKKNGQMIYEEVIKTIDVSGIIEDTKKSINDDIFVSTLDAVKDGIIHDANFNSTLNSLIIPGSPKTIEDVRNDLTKAIDGAINSQKGGFFKNIESNLDKVYDFINTKNDDFEISTDIEKIFNENIPDINTKYVIDINTVSVCVADLSKVDPSDYITMLLGDVVGCDAQFTPIRGFNSMVGEITQFLTGFSQKLKTETGNSISNDNIDEMLDRLSSIISYVILFVTVVECLYFITSVILFFASIIYLTTTRLKFFYEFSRNSLFSFGFLLLLFTTAAAFILQHFLRPVSYEDFYRFSFNVGGAIVMKTFTMAILALYT